MLIESIFTTNTTIKHKMAGIIISPLNAALYGTDFVVDDNKVNIYKPEPIDDDIQNENVFYELLRLIDRELANRRDFESGNVLYDTIRSNSIGVSLDSPTPYRE